MGLSFTKEGMLRRGAIRYGLGIFFGIILLLVIMFSGLGSSSLTVDDRIASKDYVDVGITENKEVMKIGLDLVEKSLTRKCLLVDSRGDTLGMKDVSFYLRDNNFVPSGKAELYSVETSSRIVPKNLVYWDVPYPCTIFDNKTMAEAESTCYKSELKSYENVTEYYDVDVLLGELDVGGKMEAGSLDFSIPKKLKVCFNTPIVETANGWGNAGTVFVKVGEDLLVDKQHSSWWDLSYAHKRNVIITNNDALSWNDARINFTLNTSDSSKFKPDCTDIAIIDSNGNSVDWANETACKGMTVIWFRNVSLASGANKIYELYYGNPNASYAKKSLQEIQRASISVNGSNSMLLWRFDNDLSDNSSNGNGGSACGVNAGGHCSCSANYTTSFSGKFGNALSLETSTLIKASDYHFLDSLGQGTVEFWWHHSSTSGVGHIINSEWYGVGGDNLLFYVGTQKVYQVNNGTQQKVPHSIIFDTTKFEHIALTWNNITKNMSIYIGGVIYNSSIFDGTIIKNNVNLVGLGMDTNCNHGVKGEIDDFRVMNFDVGDATIKEDALAVNFTLALGAEQGPNAPSTPNVALMPSTAYTNTKLNCSAGNYINDKDGDNMTVYFNLTVGGSPVSEYTLLDQPNGSLPSWIISEGNYTKNDVVRCYMKLFDGELYSNSSYVEITISNSAPNITSYNAGSLNRTQFYEDSSIVDFQENETVRFSVNASDADSDPITYNWFVDDVIQNWFLSWIDLVFGFNSAGTYDVRAVVNDTEANDTQNWSVDIANVVNKFWSVDYIEPTPANSTPLGDHVVNISVVVSPTLKAAALKTIFHNYSDFNGNFSSTALNSTDKSIQLSYPALTGSYTSSIYEFESNIALGNLSWADSLSTDGGFEAQNGLVGLWRMNQESPPVVDYSGNGNDGTCSGASCPVIATGKRGKAYSFDGNDDYLAVNAGSSLDMANSMTVSAWVKSDGFAKNYNSIAGRTDNGNWGQGWGFYYVSSSMKFWINGWNTNVASIPFSDTSSWHYVVGIYNGSTISIYIDGVKGADDAYSGNVTNIGSLEIGRNTHYVDSTQNYYWNGSIDEVMIWNRSLSPQEVLENYNALMANVTFQARSCDDANCNTEEFTGPTGVNSYYTNAEYESLSNLQPNRWFQYKAFLNAPDADFTPKLYNVTFKGIASSYYEDVNISKAWISMNGANTSMSGSGFSWSYVNNNLNKGTYTYRVYVNDSFGNVNVTQTRTFTVPSYDITFNVMSGEDGSPKNNVNITCDYSGFSQNDTTNMYGPYAFPVGSWTCIFRRAGFFNETHSFIVNADKVENVVISVSAYLTVEEHTQLDWLYNCIRYGSCDLYSMVKSTNLTTGKIWQQYLPTDKAVVVQEDRISGLLSATSNITINYTINIPFKEGYETGELLPIRIFYWFTNSNGTCYNQDKQTDSNRAEIPFCVPLMAEYLGPNNGSVKFKVDLRPNLPTGTYNITRSIDIDPPVDGGQVWINYGREIIGSINVINTAKADANLQTENTLLNTVEAKMPHLSNLAGITGKVVEDITGNGKVYGIYLLIGLAMICATIISTQYFKSRQ